MTPFQVNLAAAFGAALVVVVAAFGAAVRRGRFDTIDTAWGLGFAVIAVVGAGLSAGHGDAVARAVVTACTVVWGVRLAVHIHLRNRHRGEDRRYAAILANAGPHPRRRVFVRVYLVQAVLLWFIAMPVQAAQYGHGSFGFGDGGGRPLWPVWVGLAVWTVGFVFEAVGDAQLRRFSADPANADRVLDTGLWRYTRHPNYFGDACVWWGLYAMACRDWVGAATILSPVVMTGLLAKGTGKPLMERDIGERRPGYRDYVRRTSGFVPLPPRR